ncbi:hypothetical protein [Hyphomonas sp.]|uniref:hypothetical protein n=1 Tax=Hyphomonas sp. TaxID=87 RepID=UPI00391C5051
MVIPGLAEIEARVIRTLEAKGPRIGKELALDLPDVPSLALWQACYKSRELHISHFASYYLRFDITRGDQVRLSPSILRDFLSFTLFGLPGQRDRMIERQGTLSNYHREVSKQKIDVAQEVMSSLLVKMPREIRANVCAFIAGDLAYFLAHNEPREHAGLGEMVKGSDIDIIVIYQDLSDEIVKGIENDITELKNYYLRHPDYRHEIDFIVKSRAKMERQFGYTDIHDKIASKIAYESMFLGGSLPLYMNVRGAMKRTGVDELIEADFEHALHDRKHAMRTLLEWTSGELDEEIRSLFYFSQERVEFT